MSTLTLVGWALVGLVCGWAVHPVADRLGLVPPLVTLAQPLALLLLAAILGYVAWVTHRAVHVRKVRLEPHQAVNRLVLARASALVAALVGGGYLGYALSWVGDAAEQADQRILGSLAAAGCALAAVVAALLLERACRVHDDSPGDGG
ncbi:MAG TPA: DUF3180 family protein [Nocardioides sp.]|nr:DUF3180 family protein [Nocardioides sp.]